MSAPISETNGRPIEEGTPAPVFGRSPSGGRRILGARPAHSMLARGEPMVWLCGGALALCIAMIVVLVLLFLFQGAKTFWPLPVVQVELRDGSTLAGEIARIETYNVEGADSSDIPLTRRLLRTGNFDLAGTHFTWANDADITERSEPEWMLVVERLSWGRFYGVPVAFSVDGERVAETPADSWRLYEEHHGAVRERWHQRRDLETHAIGRLNHEVESARLTRREAELAYGADSAKYRDAQAELDATSARVEKESARLRAEIATLNAENARYRLIVRTAQGREAELALDEIVRAYPANRISLGGKIRIYADRWWEFLSDEPREANSEGGVWPAIFGTIVMTLLMTVAVVPFGVLAALFLREYAKPGLMLSAVRIAINNLAGVPSIVFGVFGLGFFCYLLGASIDELFFAAQLPNPTYGKGGVLWASLTLALLTLPVVIVATEEALAAVPKSMREGSYACGASKWQTLWRIVLPRALPGIMTGIILAMARGAGEVAPLMLVGAVKLAPELPLDSIFPYIHPERSFMHLGFHIYDLGFQSQNSEASKPLVYTTTLLLIALVASLNLAAVFIRTRLRRKFEGGQF